MHIRSTVLAAAVTILGALLSGSQAHAQFPPYDPSKPIVREFAIPPSPVHSPQEELQTIKIAEGYRLELLASEPLISDPVAMTFDPDGRVWLVEMRDFMPNADGDGDQAGNGMIAVLEDTNGDGKLDKRTEFIGGLVLPRSVCWTTDGILVGENGNIWLCRDTNGDLKADTKELVTKYTPGNVEHSLNGLMPAMDNWLYNGKEGLRLRRVDGKWIVEPTIGRGQWGITQDDHGYLYYNVNAQLIRGDIVPCYSPNAHFTNPMVNLELYRDQEIWPIRVNPGINRGYIETFLRPDGTMILPNANCGPVVFRGDNLPADARGDIFINEPSGNLIRRQRLVDENGFRSNSKNAYEGKTEFIASTDERFRPVNMFNAPDGTIWMLDMYKGVIQDRAYITDYLKKEARSRNLETPLNMGRIWRIVHESTQPRQPVALSKATSAELVGLLSHPNGWHRDMAQQLLVQRNDSAVLPQLKTLATSGENPLGRLHALWVLDGMKKLDGETLMAMLRDAEPNIRASTVFLSRFEAMRDSTSMVVDRLVTLASRESDPIVRMQIAFTLGLVPTAAADTALEPILKEFAENPMLLDGLLAGFSGRETEFLSSRLPLKRWANTEPWREKLLTTAAGIVWRQRQPLPVLRMLELVGSRPADRVWQQIALLDGLGGAPVNRGRGRTSAGRALSLPAAPDSFDKLRHSPDPNLAETAEAVASHLAWPGKDGQPLPVLPPLSPEHQKLYDIGKQNFANICAACHHPQGFGDAGKGPPLIDSDWLSDENRITRVVLFGLRGPITLNGEPFNKEGTLEMPGHYQSLDDEKIAGILTYVRREWAEKPTPVEPSSVSKIRASMEGRTTQWSEKELLESK